MGATLLLAVSASQIGRTNDGRVLICHLGRRSCVSVDVNRVEGPGSKCPGSRYSIENITKISHDGREVRIDSAQLEYVNVYKNGEDSPDESTKIGRTRKWTFPRNVYTFPKAAAAKELQKHHRSSSLPPLTRDTC